MFEFEGDMWASWATPSGIWETVTGTLVFILAALGLQRFLPSKTVKDGDSSSTVDASTGAAAVGGKSAHAQNSTARRRRRSSTDHLQGVANSKQLSPLPADPTEAGRRVDQRNTELERVVERERRQSGGHSSSNGSDTEGSNTSDDHVASDGSSDNGNRHERRLTADQVLAAGQVGRQNSAPQSEPVAHTQSKPRGRGRGRGVTTVPTGRRQRRIVEQTGGGDALDIQRQARADLQVMGENLDDMERDLHSLTYPTSRRPSHGGGLEGQGGQETTPTESTAANGPGAMTAGGGHR